jgi:hypothetical protein
MAIGAPTLLVGYAYHQAGGGGAGVAAALAALEKEAQQVTDLVKKTGSGQGFELLERSKAAALKVGTFPLRESAGQVAGLIQDLIHPPSGYGNPLLTPQTVLNPGVVGAYAAYQYQKAQETDQGAEATRAATQAATESALGFPEDLYASARPGGAPLKTKAKAYFDFRDTDQDGFVSPAEAYAHALSHPHLDPRDTNQDAFVSPAEELAYLLKHPEVEVLHRLGPGHLDLQV